MRATRGGVSVCCGSGCVSLSWAGSVAFSGLGLGAQAAPAAGNARLLAFRLCPKSLPRAPFARPLCAFSPDPCKPPAPPLVTPHYARGVTECAQGSFLIMAGVARGATGRGLRARTSRGSVRTRRPLTLVFVGSPPSLVLRGAPNKNSLPCAPFAPPCSLFRHYPLTALLHTLALAALANARRSLRSRMPVARYARECSLGARWFAGLRGAR